MAVSIQHSEVLNSWKEIAAYVGRGVRTVQRWERELGLPVRRPLGKRKVVALRQEIDAWISRRPLGAIKPPVRDAR
jgi:predicted DNA-binding transcriptional regulator AlpA